MDEVTISKMKKKQICRVKDIKTSSPRTLFRRLSDALEEWGYKTNFSSDSIEIKKDEVGNSGYVNAKLSANKLVLREEEGKGSLTLDFINSSKVKKYSLLAGAAILLVSAVVLLMSGIAQFGVGIAIGIMVLCLALISMLKRKAAVVSYPVTVWVEGTGEIYRAQLSESRGELESERGMEQEQVVSELSVRIAAESEPPVELDELQSDIERLLAKLESLGEQGG
jgi:uncharacterized coiled-coil protein SlyX